MRTDRTSVACVFYRCALLPSRWSLSSDVRLLFAIVRVPMQL